MTPRRSGRRAPASAPPAQVPLWFQGQAQTDLRRRGGPLVLVRGEGTRVWDAGGRSYLDARSGLWAVTLGYGRSEVVSAVTEALRRLSFAPLTETVSPDALDLADRLCRVLPGDLRAVALVPTGSEAVDTALKVARGYHAAEGHGRRRIVIGREYSAHGSTYAGASLSDPDRGLLRGIGPRLAGIRFAPAPYRYRCLYCAAAPACTLACVDAVEQVMRSAGPDRVAAVFAEPVPGPGGVLVPPERYWPALRALCDRHGVLLVADEVVTGLGRTGRWFACDHWGVVPDLMLLGKGLTGGYQALGAVAMRRHVAARLERHVFAHGFTYSGHPAACAAARACLALLDTEQLVARAAAKGARLLHHLRDALGACPIVGEVRGLGLMAAVELVRDRRSRLPLALRVRDLDALERDLRRRGVLAFVDNPLIVAPPFVISDAEVDHLVEAVAESVRALARAGGVGRRRPSGGGRGRKPGGVPTH